MPRGSKERMDATRKIRNTKERIKNTLKVQTRKEWTTKQAVDDIERQLGGEGFDPKAVDTSPSTCRLQHPAQKRMVAALAAPAEPTLEAQYNRRNNAIQAIIAYCFVKEGRTPCHQSHNSVTKHTQRPKEPMVDSPAHAAALSVFVSHEKERPRRCFVCIGKAMSLAPDHPNIEKLVHEFRAPSDLTKHFRKRHLLNLRDINKIECRVCNMSLDHKMYFQNHALRIHGTVS